MFLAKILLQSFRNYHRLELPFTHQVNLFVGQNAQGKTNLLEAIYVMAMTKSHRTFRDKELIGWNQPFAKITGEIKRGEESLDLEVIIAEKGKKVRKNGLEQRRLSQYIGACNVVMFAPEDLSIVKGSPQHRRRFMDMEIGQLSPLYLHYLSQYQKLLQQKNQFLKLAKREQKQNAMVMLDVWNQQLTEFAVKIMLKRYQYIAQLQMWAAGIHAGITQEKEELCITYKSESKVLAGMMEDVAREIFYQELMGKAKQELERGTSLHGPHRDDLTFRINQIDVQTFGSQGQQRTTALSLKLAEIELIYHEVGDYPLLLLDDVLSELDEIRQTHLLTTIQDKVQTFVTSTSLDGVQLKHLPDREIFKVQDGTIVSN
ncbi:DNA replication/repair protein RecF [Rubeoparvulum massiliense]|uniref:DNA replication/repair protein RecF n=1 Tax=Rubeoparvulum massiliense TaxID=1631346 RepID=UPI00065DC8BB|nr:DNA replication/repair protein RecF [Rubeoparvulum massiliense]